MRIRLGVAGACVCTLLLIGSVAALPHGDVAAVSAQGTTAGAGKVAASKFKAIWEPVNIPEDLELLSVHFVNADEGWVAGGKSAYAGGVIYHTKDGGATWELQLGDAQSNDRHIRELRFIDATHGFAIQGSTGDHMLLSTTDGQSWRHAGSVREHGYDYVFTTPAIGFIADRNGEIIRTADGGKKWQPVYRCRIKTEIAGLTRDADCHIRSMHFPNSTTGYAIGGPLPEDSGNVLAKTEDGGVTWNAWVVLPGESASEGSLRFVDANTGVLRAKDGEMFRTTDGGKTWTGVSGQAELKSDVSFADAEVGWAIHYRKMTYTSNGGRSWVSRNIAFPAMVEDSFLAARDRGYAVGDHGMVYRYRVVPIDYTAKGMIAAPAVAVK